MAKVTLYKPDGKVLYEDATNVTVKHGVLTFDHKGNSLDSRSVTITATVPFVVEEEEATGL